MDAKTPTARSAAISHDEATTKFGNAVAAILLAGLAALFLYGYVPHFLFG